MMKLARLRKQIDSIDTQIVKLLSNRARISSKITKIKKNNNMSVYSPERESAILKRLSSINKGPLRADDLKAIYREIMSSTLSLAKPLKIAYLGPKATFTHLASLKKFGSQVDYLPCETIGGVFNEVERDNADYGVVPIENSTEGVITHTLDMFIDSELKIFAQVTLEVSLNLLSRCPKSKIKKIYSNPQVFGQCRIWLDKNMPNAERIDVSSTTRAAQLCLRQKLSSCIASSLAAKVYKLNVIAKDIEDIPHNITRFLIIGKNTARPSKKDRTSIMFSIKDRVGALHDMLLPFKKNKINLTKIESRPSRRRAWDYYFFVDLDGHFEDAPIKRALKSLESKATYLKILGSYPIE